MGLGFDLIERHVALGGVLEAIDQSDERRGVGHTTIRNTPTSKTTWTTTAPTHSARAKSRSRAWSQTPSDQFRTKTTRPISTSRSRSSFEAIWIGVPLASN